MYLNVEGIVLRAVDYGDRDAILTILTKKHGKLTVKARGIRRKNSPHTAACQLFCYSEFSLFEYRGQYSVNDAHILALFDDLRCRIEHLALASYFAQVADMISLEDVPSPELLSLMLNCLYALSHLSYPDLQVKAAFEMRAACISGYLPGLEGCVYCGSAEADRLDLYNGGIVCRQCTAAAASGNPGSLRQLSGGSLMAMRYICSCDMKKLLAFRTGQKDLLLLSDAAESYLSVQLDRVFSALNYYKSLISTDENEALPFEM